MLTNNLDTAVKQFPFGSPAQTKVLFLFGTLSLVRMDVGLLCYSSASITHTRICLVSFRCSRCKFVLRWDLTSCDCLGFFNHGLTTEGINSFVLLLGWFRVETAALGLLNQVTVIMSLAARP
jgi:hypothetical protein